MNKEKEMHWGERLVNKYPHLFPKGCFYFECRDGWSELITELVANIAEIASKLKAPTDPEEAKDFSPCTISQIKEKWGGLRIYMDGQSSKEICDLVDEAELKSFKICERCGKSGRPRGSGWVVVECDECYAEYEKKT